MRKQQNIHPAIELAYYVPAAALGTMELVRRMRGKPKRRQRRRVVPPPTPNPRIKSVQEFRQSEKEAQSLNNHLQELLAKGFDSVFVKRNHPYYVIARQHPLDFDIRHTRGGVLVALKGSEFVVVQNPESNPTVTGLKGELWQVDKDIAELESDPFYNETPGRKAYKRKWLAYHRRQRRELEALLKKTIKQDLQQSFANPRRSRKQLQQLSERLQKDEQSYLDDLQELQDDMNRMERRAALPYTRGGPDDNEREQIRQRLAKADRKMHRLENEYNRLRRLRQRAEAATDTGGPDEMPNPERKKQKKIVAFKIGDFYEFFAADAIVANQILGLPLTKRFVKGKATDAIVTGFPYHMLERNREVLKNAGWTLTVMDNNPNLRADNYGERGLDAQEIDFWKTNVIQVFNLPAKPQQRRLTTNHQTLSEIASYLLERMAAKGAHRIFIALNLPWPADIEANPSQSAYSVAASKGYPYIRGEGRVAKNGYTWMTRFTRDSKGESDGLYVGYDDKKRRWLIEHEDMRSKNPETHGWYLYAQIPPDETFSKFWYADLEMAKRFAKEVIKDGGKTFIQPVNKDKTKQNPRGIIIANTYEEANHLIRESETSPGKPTLEFIGRTRDGKFKLRHKKTKKAKRNPGAPVQIDALAKMFHGNVSGAARDVIVSANHRDVHLQRIGQLPYIKMLSRPNGTAHDSPKHACGKCAIMLPRRRTTLSMNANKRLIIGGAGAFAAGKRLRKTAERTNPQLRGAEINLGRVEVMAYITPEKHSNSRIPILYYHPHGEETGRERDMPELHIDEAGMLFIPERSGRYTIDERGIIN